MGQRSQPIPLEQAKKHPVTDDISLTVLRRTESTQDIARRMALDGEPDWSAVIALEQTRGRGRAGHSWLSPPGKNLALSVILRPSLSAKHAPVLSLAAAVAAANILQAKGMVGVGLKWPNDVLAREKKIAGILLEAVAERETIRHVVVGLGLNLNSRQEDFPNSFPVPATSYLICTGRTWDIHDAAESFLREMKSVYQSMEERGSSFVVELWLEKWAHKNQLMIHEGKTGRAVGISSEGFLIMEAADRSRAVVSAGEVIPIPTVD